MRDLGVTAALAPQVPEAVVGVLAAVTFLGSPTFVGLGVAGYAAAGTYRGFLDRATAVRLVAAVFLALGVASVLKHGLAIPRPPAHLHRISETGFGFPSGHAVATAGGSLALARLHDGPSPRLRYSVAAAATALIAATRILLGVHYLVDVVAGVVVGVATVGLGLYGTRRYPAGTAVVVGTVIVAGLALELL